MRGKKIIGGKKRRLREHIRIAGTGGAATKGILGGGRAHGWIRGRSSNASSRAEDDESHSGTTGRVVTGTTVSPSPTGLPQPRSTGGTSPLFGLGLSEDHNFPQAPTSHPNQNGATPSNPNLMPLERRHDRIHAPPFPKHVQ